jgi:hypothetical protein
MLIPYLCKQLMVDQMFGIQHDSVEVGRSQSNIEAEEHATQTRVAEPASWTPEQWLRGLLVPVLQEPE